jgi:hypothetical protein
LCRFSSPFNNKRSLYNQNAAALVKKCAIEKGKKLGKKGELKNIEEKATDELLMPLSCKHFGNFYI